MVFHISFVLPDLDFPIELDRTACTYSLRTIIFTPKQMKYSQLKAQVSNYQPVSIMNTIYPSVQPTSLGS